LPAGWCAAMAEFRMPSLGADMEAGTLVEWRVAPGESVTRGDIIAVVETQKGAIEIEVFETGTVRDLAVEPGQKVPVGTVMARIEAAAGKPVAAPAAPAAVAAVAAEPRLIAPKPPPPRPALAVAPPAPIGARRLISPAARKRAAELGVDLDALAGSGPKGVVTLADVEAAKAPPPPKPLAPPAKPAAADQARMAAMRRAIAAAMTRSKREIPHFYLATTIDLTGLLTWLEQANRERGVDQRLLYAAPLIKAVAVALKKFPELNGVWIEDRFEPRASVHAGIAISLRGGGLIAPAIHDADTLDLDNLMRGFRDLVGRARAGGLKSSELSDSTVTITSLGDQGVETVFPVIYPPQVAMVGFGSIVERPWAIPGPALAVRRVITATLAADHRVSDGHRGALFLRALDGLLQKPEEL